MSRHGSLNCIYRLIYRRMSGCIVAMMFLISTLTACGGGGGGGGTGSVVAEVPAIKAQPAQQGVWILSLPQTLFAQPVLSLAMSTNYRYLL